LVLFALILSLSDERLQEVALLRALGAHNRLLYKTLLFEWFLLGGISGLVAGMAAISIGWVAARQLFNMDTFYLNWRVPLIACVSTAIVVLLLSLPFLRRLLSTRPAELLQKL
jgi:putative ABC transport system permease protein